MSDLHHDFTSTQTFIDDIHHGLNSSLGNPVINRIDPEYLSLNSIQTAGE